MAATDRAVQKEFVRLRKQIERAEGRIKELKSFEKLLREKFPMINEEI